MPEPLPRPGPLAQDGAVSVLAVRTIADPAGGPTRYRLNQTVDVRSGAQECRTVVGPDELRAAAAGWVERVIERTPQP
ncbi:hypothetical protein [Cumulibacter manganitolerans]|uniref:hypothetical protein n=1 Tax=Cumulibacter manganitolerans TaxID=1884992 RepID=UPI0012951981|nr:hypothetical protein [Cumulibacter manganitolerans]